MSSYPKLTAFSLWLALSAALLTLMDSAQPQPFMDEVFHIPQAQKYCQGRFLEWDPKITTLPGLYFVSIGVLTPLKALANMTSDDDLEVDLCSAKWLRAINLLMAGLTVLILERITSQIHGDKHVTIKFIEDEKLVLSALNLSLFPLLYFFTFLYYTDVGSTFMVLLMYCLHLDGRDWLASFIGLLAVCFRQTNIIWVAFVALQSIGPILIHNIHEHMLEGPGPVKFSLTTRGQIVELFQGTALLICDPKRFFDLISHSLYRCIGYVMVWLIFAAFLNWNGGVVVGDKSAHVAVFHPAQILYFFAFSCAMSAPYCATRWRQFFKYTKKHYMVILLAAFGIYLIIENYTMAHKYLLADNRHYTFYIWRRIITRTEWSKFLLLPVYLYGGFCVLYSLKRTNVIFKLTFPLFVAINLIPQLLLEFRYFIIPFLLYRLQIRPQSWWKLFAELAIFAFINAFTIAIYILKPFRWEHEPEDVQRFIW